MSPDPRFAQQWPSDGRRRLAAALAAIILAGVGLTTPGTTQIPLPEPAQVNPQPTKSPQQPKREEHSYQGGYSKSRSHELFRACDANSDDRLDILETTEAFDVLLSAKDHKSFARFDTDRNGFVTWPEFDQRFRKGLEHGGTFRVRTSRPFALPDPPPQPLTPLQKFMRLHDKDGDGSLSPDEISDLLKQMGLPDDLGNTLLQADRDQSGTIDETELAPWFQGVGSPTATTAGTKPGGLRQPWLDADANSNQAIDQPELDTLLRRLDPALLRWTKNLIDKLDTDRDGQLSAAELEALEPATDKDDDATDTSKTSGTTAKKQSPEAKPTGKPVQTPDR